MFVGYSNILEKNVMQFLNILTKKTLISIYVFFWIRPTHCTLESNEVEAEVKAMEEEKAYHLEGSFQEGLIPTYHSWGFSNGTSHNCTRNHLKLCNCSIIPLFSKTTEKHVVHAPQQMSRDEWCSQRKPVA
jgi:hypothetical protein